MNALENKGHMEQIFAYVHLFVWVKVWATHTSHPWSDDKTLI